MKIEDVAEICHEANRILCKQQGDDSQSSWKLAHDWQRESAIKGVKFALDNPTVGAKQQHEAWMIDKLNDGWTYGPVKDAEKKTHPALLAYDLLPEEQKMKDYVFTAIVKAFAKFIEKEN